MIYYNESSKISIYYERLGSGAPLLFLHGLGSCSADWMFQTPILSTKYEVFTLDLRGHGKSDKPHNSYSVPTLASDVADLLTSLNIKPVHVVGLSLGSFVAMQLACDFPHLVKSLTLTGTTSCIKDLGFWQLLLRKTALTLSSMEKIGALIANRLFPDPDQANLRALCSHRIASNEKRIYSKIANALYTFDVKGRLSEIRCPVLVIAGAKDPITPLSHAQTIVNRVRQGKLAVIESSRHAPPLDNPERFNEQLLSFLETEKNNRDKKE